MIGFLVRRGAIWALNRNPNKGAGPILGDLSGGGGGGGAKKIPQNGSLSELGAWWRGGGSYVPLSEVPIGGCGHFRGFVLCPPGQIPKMGYGGDGKSPTDLLWSDFCKGILVCEGLLGVVSAFLWNRPRQTPKTKIRGRESAGGVQGLFPAVRPRNFFLANLGGRARG